MKRYIALFSIILVLITITSKGQVQLLKDTLIKSCNKTPFNNQFIITYSDQTNSPDDLPQPKDTNGQTAELVDQKLNSLERLNKISNMIFTPEEIKYLNEHKCYVSCLVESSGKIISASIWFSNNDPVISIKQLAEFSRQIRENLTFELLFDRDIKKEGYLSLSFSAFHSLFPLENNKIKPH